MNDSNDDDEATHMDRQNLHETWTLPPKAMA